LQTNPVLQIPTTATLDYEGKTFVFVQTADDKFERRDIKIGRRSEQFCEITAGIKEGDQVVTEGGFALKSRMLSELIAGE
jgi:cobalt-zinc-cadmium efflux system membrane fusion protein